MRILWLVNIVMPELAEHLGRTPSVFGGWLTGAMNAVRESGNELIVCTTERRADVLHETVGNIEYYLVPSGTVEDMEAYFNTILQVHRPDVVHIYGTEYSHALSMARAADSKKLLVTIQGAMTYLHSAVYAGIPPEKCRDTVLHKLLRLLHKGGESIALQRQSFKRRAVAEQEVLLRAKYINGGSHWGDVVARSINPDCRVMSCGLVLRPEFYTDLHWTPYTCERHSIFTLFSYPIKGFHKFLEALRLVVSEFPDTIVYVVSNKLPFRHYTGLKRHIMNMAPDYNWYVQGLIESYELQEHLVFLGHLSAAQVRDRMLKCNVFVSASAIENQSTTLGEAMILGVPSIASCVGAIQEVIEDGRNGFLYPFSEPYLLADKIITIFSDDELAVAFSDAAKARSQYIYDREQNLQSLLNIYNSIAEESIQ